MDQDRSPRPTVAALCEQVGARAAGYWRREGDRLVQGAFVPAADLPTDVALGFEQATQSVGLDQTALGIVRAAVDGEPTVSIAEALPPDTGSGRWLRAFDAAMSIAVPLRDDRGRVFGVLSVALPPSSPREPGDVVALIVDAGRLLA